MREKLSRLAWGLYNFDMLQNYNKKSVYLAKNRNFTCDCPAAFGILTSPSRRFISMREFANSVIKFANCKVDNS